MSIVIIQALKRKINVSLVSKASLALFGKVLGTQGLSMLMSLLNGIIVIRALDKEGYAIYTVFFSIYTIVLSLSNSNILIGFKKIGGKIWDSDEQLSSLIISGNKLRFKIFLLVVPFVIAYGAYLLKNQGVQQSFDIIIGFFLILGATYPNIKKIFYLESLLLRNLRKQYLSIELLQQFLRLISLLIIISITEQLEFYIILSVLCITEWVGFYYLVSKCKPFFKKNANFNHNYYKEIAFFPKKTWHNVLFFTFQDQVSLILMGFFGKLSNIADLGAISRFGLINNLLTSTITTMFVPVFSKSNDSKYLLSIVASLISASLIFSIVLITLANYLPHYFLWILGEKYYDLDRELKLVLMNNGIGLIMYIIYLVNSSKGWIKYSVVSEIPVYIITYVIGIMIFQYNTLAGVLKINFIILMSKTILQSLDFANGLKSLHQKHS